jgi:MerR family transcriptional regulator, light-induced transcriptional regulator
MAIYSIKDLEKLSGIQAHTIRIWEKRYQLVRPKRTTTNIRVYSDEDLKRLLNVAILNGNGLKISKIAQLSENEVKDRILNLTDDSSKTENQIDSLILSMIDLNEHKFEKILSRMVIQVGFEEAITQVIYPFLVKIGVLWQTGNINPAQEHFVTNLIRQKLFVAIDSVLVDELPEKKRFILFLPEGELHDIGLLYYNYLIKKNGHHVLYLGQSVPFPDIIEVHKLQPADYLVTSFTTSIPHEMLSEYLNALSTTFPKIKIFVIGTQVDAQELKKHPNITKVENPTALKTQFKSF